MTEKLQALSLITRVASELGNHLGISDRTLAEFIISKAEKVLKKCIKKCSSKSLSENVLIPAARKFQADLLNNGADLTLSVVSQLLSVILEMSPYLKRLQEEKQRKSNPRQLLGNHVVSCATEV